MKQVFVACMTMVAILSSPTDWLKQPLLKPTPTWFQLPPQSPPQLQQPPLEYLDPPWFWPYRFICKDNP